MPHLNTRTHMMSENYLLLNSYGKIRCCRRSPKISNETEHCSWPFQDAQPWCSCSRGKRSRAFSFQPCRMQNGTFISQSHGHYLTSRSFWRSYLQFGKNNLRHFRKKTTFFMRWNFIWDLVKNCCWWQTGEMWTCSVKQWACSRGPRSRMSFEVYPASPIFTSSCEMPWSRLLRVFPKRSILPPAGHQYTKYIMTVVDLHNALQTHRSMNLLLWNAAFCWRNIHNQQMICIFLLICIVYQRKGSYWKVSPVNVDMNSPI